MGSTYERGIPCLVCWARRACTIDFCPALSALVSPIQNILLTENFFTFLVSIAQQPGQAGVLVRLSLCLWRGLKSSVFCRLIFVLPFLTFLMCTIQCEKYAI